MAKYRSRLEIIADILNAAGNGTVKKTRVMYIANLSYELLKKYLKEVLAIGFMRVNDEGYEITEKGRLFLEKYQQFSSKYSKLESELKNMRLEREILENMCRPSKGSVRKQILIH
ncbi:MAG: winged helix-turn-helix domain-containing protein [Candidatus Bathyarchaeia archaeon]